VRKWPWLLLLCCACSVPEEAGFPDVQAIVHDRSGYGIKWYRGAVGEHAIRDEVRRLVAEPLSKAATVRVAIINNRRLQATYEELGVAQADLVQAGMIDNPSLGVAARFPTEGSPSPNIEGDFGINFLSIFTIAARERIAGAKFDEAKLRVADEVLMLVGDTRKSYVGYQAAQQLLRVDLAIAQAAQASYDSALALHKAGNINDLQLAQEQALYEGARLRWLDSMADVVQWREQLNRLMGLWGADAEMWRVDQMLPGGPRQEVPLLELETLAITQRLDLGAAIAHTKMLTHALGLAEDWGWLHGAELGASFERESSGELLVGPSVELELPIFDQGQARSARLVAQLRRSQGHVTALAIDIRSEVRLLRAQLLMTRRRAEHHRDVVIPLRERIVKLTLEQYNFMLVGVFELLAKRQDQSAAYHDYIHAVRDYWFARAELRRAVGGRLPEAVRATVVPMAAPQHAPQPAPTMP
jgi:cobalt-zinc-cadmium efflux system outer membrane protein